MVDYNDKQRWDEKWKTDEIYNGLHQALYSALMDYLKGEVLDMGCGIGQVGKDLGSRYHGVDHSAVAIERAKKVCPDAELVADDCRKTLWNDRQFDTVLLNSVVEHFQDYRPLLREAQRVCRGRIVIALPINSRGAEHYYPHWPMWKCLEAFSPYGDVVEYRQIAKDNLSKPHWAIVVVEVT